MKPSKLLAVLLGMLAACAAAIGTARADSVLYDQASVVEGQQGFVQSFDITTPGMLTITVSNIPWLDAVSNLTSFMSSTTGVVGTTMNGAGTESINIGPGMYYAHWFGDAQGVYNAGVLGINVQFQPAGSATVPVPASLVLMLSGLGFLAAWRRQALG